MNFDNIYKRVDLTKIRIKESVRYQRRPLRDKVTDIIGEINDSRVDLEMQRLDSRIKR